MSDEVTGGASDPKGQQDYIPAVNERLTIADYEALAEENSRNPGKKLDDFDQVGGD